jgi:hypothetical protein
MNLGRVDAGTWALVCVWLSGGCFLTAAMWTTPLRGRPRRWLVIATAACLTAGLISTPIWLIHH